MSKKVFPTSNTTVANSDVTNSNKSKNTFLTRHRIKILGLGIGSVSILFIILGAVLQNMILALIGVLLIVLPLVGYIMVKAGPTFGFYFPYVLHFFVFLGKGIWNFIMFIVSLFGG